MVDANKDAAPAALPPSDATAISTASSAAREAEPRADEHVAGHEAECAEEGGARVCERASEGGQPGATTNGATYLDAPGAAAPSAGCRFLEEDGRCAHGDGCAFSHSAFVIQGLVYPMGAADAVRIWRDESHAVVTIPWL